ncbi:MAG: hypothetical protein GY845_08670 [Planctomycetes bacterium]|nr:hypothetical protein [Planctomycetota bacterium]
MNIIRKRKQQRPPIFEILRQILPGLEKLVEVCHDSLSSTIENIQTSTECASKEVSETICSKKAILALYINGKGRKVSLSEIQNINPNDFAVYLDTTSGTFAFSLPGEQPTIKTVQEAGIDGVQDILGVMLEYPRLNFGNVSIGQLLSHRKGMTPDAFRKAMAKIRYAIQNGNEKGPLLLHFDRSHFSISDSGHAWRISMQHGDLCFIKFLPVPHKFRRKDRR